LGYSSSKGIIPVDPNILSLQLNDLFHLDEVVNVPEVYLLNTLYYTDFGYL